MVVVISEKEAKVLENAGIDVKASTDIIVDKLICEDSTCQTLVKTLHKKKA